MPKLDYIHNNPVEAGLVANAKEYLYRNAKIHLTNDASLLEIDYKKTRQTAGSKH